jgi:hypothetical protein
MTGILAFNKSEYYLHNKYINALFAQCHLFDTASSQNKVNNDH